MEIIYIITNIIIDGLRVWIIKTILEILIRVAPSRNNTRDNIDVVIVVE